MTDYNIISQNNIKRNMLEGTIEQVFYENIFRVFRRYCAMNGISHMADLMGFNFDRLYNIAGLGEIKIKKIKARWQEYIESKTDFLGVNEKLDKEISSANFIYDIHASNQNLGIECLRAIGVSKQIIAWLKGKSINKISDLQRIDWNELYKVSGIGEKKASILKEKIKLLSTPIDELFKDAWVKIKKNHSTNILTHRAFGLTLQKVGEMKGVSRERIRQIEKKAIGIFGSLISSFADYLISRLNFRKLITYEDIFTLFDSQEDALIFKYVLMNGATKRFAYFKELDIFLIDKDVNTIRKTLEKIVKDNIPDILEFNENISMINEVLEQYNLNFINTEMFKQYLLYIGYREYKEYICNRKMPLSKLYHFIVKEHFPDGILIYEPEYLDKFRHILKEDFGYTDLPCDRAIGARIAEETVLCDRGKYIAPEYINIPVSLLEEIKQYILDSSGDSFIIAEIFNRFEQQLKQSSNIINKYFLHGVLRYYYSDEFVFSRDILSKKKDGSIKSSHIILEEYLKKRGKPISKQELRIQFPGISDAMLSNAVILNPKIIYWDTGYFAHTDVLYIVDEDKIAFRMLIKEALADNDGYTNANILYKYARGQMRDFLVINNIRNATNLYYVLEYMFGEEFYFSRPHILSYNPQGRFGTLDLIRKYIEDREKVSFSEIMRYSSRLQLNETTVYTAVAELREELIQLSEDEYILKSKFYLPQDVLNSITGMLNKLIEDRGYLALGKIEDFYAFPFVGYSWTPHLLESIIKNYLKDFKLIEREITDRRYVTSVAVKKHSEINNYIELVIHILRHEYRALVFPSYKDMEDWLRQKGLIAKVIPKELLECGAIIISDDGKVYVTSY